MNNNTNIIFRNGSSSIYNSQNNINNKVTNKSDNSNSGSEFNTVNFYGRNNMDSYTIKSNDKSILFDTNFLIVWRKNSIFII